MASDSEGTIDELYKYTKQFIDFDKEEGPKIKTKFSIHLLGSIDLEELLQ